MVSIIFTRCGSAPHLPVFRIDIHPDCTVLHCLENHLRDGGPEFMELCSEPSRQQHLKIHVNPPAHVFISKMNEWMKKETHECDSPSNSLILPGLESLGHTVILRLIDSALRDQSSFILALRIVHKGQKREGKEVLFATAFIKQQKPGKEDPCTLDHLCRPLQCWWLCVTRQYRQHPSCAASPSLLRPGAHPGIVTGHTRSAASVSGWGRGKWWECERRPWNRSICDFQPHWRWGWEKMVLPWGCPCLSNNHGRPKLSGVALNLATY